MRPEYGNGTRLGPEYPGLALWLVDGDFAKGARWCLSGSRESAMTIYRNIVTPERGVLKTEKGTALSICAKVRISRSGYPETSEFVQLVESQIFWHRKPGLPSFSGVVRDLPFEIGVPA